MISRILAFFISFLLQIRISFVDSYQLQTILQTKSFFSPLPFKSIRTLSSSLLATPNRKSSYFRKPSPQRTQTGVSEEDKVVGTEFFGGNKVREDLFDPEIEAAANIEKIGEIPTTYTKWGDTNAFTDDNSKHVAKSLQEQLNGLLYAEDESPIQPEYKYSEQLQWISSLITSEEPTSPLQELAKGLEFYRRLDVAITSGRSLSAKEVELRWEISVVWPNFWEARVLITGKSILTITNEKEIIKQVDITDEEDFSTSILAQLTPRFWDLYHLGMNPSVELSPTVSKLNTGSLFRMYALSKVPPRLVYQPTLYDVGGREDAAAEIVPNHCFCDFIKTTGPYKQRYVATSPVEVQIERSKEMPKPRLKFSLPLSVEMQTNPTLPLPGDDKEMLEGTEPDAQYVWQPERTVATIPYGGNPQDEQVTKLRKRLYEAVIKDGLRPKTDASGRPIFFFWSYNTKACYTAETGLGMCIYEYRAKFANGNCVGIELETMEDGTERSISLTKTVEKSSIFSLLK